MLYAVAGTSKFKGTVSYRFTNRDLAGRIACLEKEGHTEVNLFALPKPMTKEEAVAWLDSNKPVAAAPRIKSVPAKVLHKPSAAPVKASKPTHQVAHEALGRELHKTSTLKFLNWADLTPECQQEYCWRAAHAQGLKIARGTFPALEASWKREGVQHLLETMG